MSKIDDFRAVLVETKKRNKEAFHEIIKEFSRWCRSHGV
jgi:hypothetical protein